MNELNSSEIRILFKSFQIGAFVALVIILVANILGRLLY